MEYLNEKHSLITNEKDKYDELCDVITDYIYDAHDGMQNDPFFDFENISNNVISNSIIESYWQYKNQTTFNKTLIPRWIGKFTIKLLENKNQYYAARYIPSKAKYHPETNKLDFYVEVVDNMEKNAVNSHLKHEFQHAWNDWKEHSTNKIFFHKTNVRVLNDYDKDIKLIQKIYKDGVDYNKEIFTDSNTMIQFINSLFYSLHDTEIPSQIKSFHADIDNEFKTNIDNVIAQIRRANILKIKKSNLTKQEIYDSNYQNILDITCYSSRTYAKYVVIKKVLDNIDKFDLEAFEKIMLGYRDIFERVLGIEYPELIYIDYGKKILDRIYKKYYKKTCRVIRSMDKIYFDLIDEYIDKIKYQNEINDPHIKLSDKDEAFIMDLLNNVKDNQEKINQESNE